MDSPKACELRSPGWPVSQVQTLDLYDLWRSPEIFGGLDLVWSGMQFCGPGQLQGPGLLFIIS